MSGSYSNSGLPSQDEHLRIEALRQAVDLWKHWDSFGHPDGDLTIVGLATDLHKFLASQTAEAK